MHRTKIFYVLVMVLLVALFALPDAAAQDETLPSVPAVKFVVNAFVSGDITGLEDYVADDVVFRSLGNPLEDTEGIEGFGQWIMLISTIMPDLDLVIHTEVVDDNMVAIRWTATGTHTGEVPTLPASGNEVTLQGMSLIHLENDRIVEWWHAYDNLSFMVQLGVMPPPGAAET